MINPDVYAYTATVLNMIMLIPQVVRAWRTKQTKDLSLYTPIIYIMASVLWTIYGFATKAIPVIVSNFVITPLNLVLVIIKLTNRK